MGTTERQLQEAGDGTETVTAAVLVIGDEILSGRTQDTNVATIARFLGGLGIDLSEVRIVPDREAEIVAALNALRTRYRYVLTTGGIGPTHDDITADAVGKAFGLPVEHHPEAFALLATRYPPGEFNEMRQRMARTPKGATLIKNPVSVAPGFQIGNVFVLAGVPKIMQAMLEDVAPRLTPGIPVTVRTITVALPEGQIAAALSAIQDRYPSLSIGSYPFFPTGGNTPGPRASFGTALVVRGRDGSLVDEAASQIETMIRAFGAVPEEAKEQRNAP